MRESYKVAVGAGKGSSLEGAGRACEVGFGVLACGARWMRFMQLHIVLEVKVHLFLVCEAIVVVMKREKVKLLHVRL